MLDTKTKVLYHFNGYMSEESHRNYSFEAFNTHTNLENVQLSHIDLVNMRDNVAEIYLQVEIINHS